MADKPIPRRAYIDRQTPTERKIRIAMEAVESLGADPRLTDAVLALSKAFDYVADWTDAQAPSVASMTGQDVDERPAKRWEPGPISISDEYGTYTPPVTIINSNLPNDNLRVVPLSRPQTDGAIKTLENMLQIAKTDGLSGVGVVAVDLQGNTSSAYEQGHNIALLIGAVARLQQRLLNHAGN